MKHLLLILFAILINGAALSSPNTTEAIDPPLPPVVVYPEVICPGDSTAIEFILVEKDSTVTYEWILSPSLEDISSLSADQCTLSVTDISVANPLLDIVVVRAQNACGMSFTSAPVRMVSPLDLPEIPLDRICTGEALLISPLQTTRVSSYIWDFGICTDWELTDGSLVDGDPFAIRYNSPGLKNYSVTITDSDGCTHAKSYEVQVYDAPPLPDASCSSEGDTVYIEWKEDPNFSYEVEYSLLPSNLETELITGTQVSVSGFISPCQFAIISIEVVGTNPVPCNKTKVNVTCRPSIKPDISFRNGLNIDAFRECEDYDPVEIIPTVNGIDNPSSGEWCIEPGSDYYFDGVRLFLDPDDLDPGDYPIIYKYTNPVDGCIERIPYTVKIISCNDMIGMDADNDGYTIEEDCDDTNPNVFPCNIEYCDGIDNNCNGEIDEGLDFEIYYSDNDRDGYGVDGTGFSECLQPPDTTTESGDCDDTNSAIYPGATEIPGNGIDEDCDGEDGPVATHELNNITIELYPNPTQGQVHIKTELARLNYKLFTLSGELVQEGTIEDSFLDLTSLSPSVYLLELFVAGMNQKVMERLVKL